MAEVGSGLNLDSWRGSGSYFEHRGHRIFYRDSQGTGPPLLLIHGFPTASYDWHRVWPELVKRFRVIAPDMIGFGFSAKPSRYDYSLFDQADLHVALLAKLGIERARVLAHDYGDTVAQELLARDADIHSVCFTNGGLFPESHRPRLVQKLLRSPIGPLVARAVNERAFRRSFAPIFAVKPSDEELAEYWQLVSSDGGARISHKLIGYISERRENRARWVGAIVQARVPVRFINGIEDPLSGAHMVARYRELVPNPNIVELHGIGHYPQVEAPEALMSAFLTPEIGG